MHIYSTSLHSSCIPEHTLPTCQSRHLGYHQTMSSKAIDLHPPTYRGLSPLHSFPPWETGRNMGSFCVDLSDLPGKTAQSSCGHPCSPRPTASVGNPPMDTGSAEKLTSVSNVMCFRCQISSSNHAWYTLIYNVYNGYASNMGGTNGPAKKSNHPFWRGIVIIMFDPHSSWPRSPFGIYCVSPSRNILLRSMFWKWICTGTPGTFDNHARVNLCTHVMLCQRWGVVRCGGLG